MRFEEVEVARVQTHLLGAERIARRGSSRTLPRAVRVVRALLFAELRRYRRARRFPKNVDFADRQMPYFIDGEGTRCAVAHLMEATGQGALVSEIARTKNNARVKELADGARVRAWLEAVGLTAAEAARIQPTYDCPPPESLILCEKIHDATIVRGEIVTRPPVTRGEWFQTRSQRREEPQSNYLRIDEAATSGIGLCGEIDRPGPRYVPIQEGALGATVVASLFGAGTKCIASSIRQSDELSIDELARLAAMSVEDCQAALADHGGALAHEALWPDCRYNPERGGCGRCAAAPAKHDGVAALTAIALVALLAARRRGGRRG
jgi:MYXO-CTERM domain-containing protein